MSHGIRILSHARGNPDTEVGRSICRDAKDDKFLELAISGGATYLISGDKDLRALNLFRGIAIVTAAEFLAATESKEDV